MIYDYIIVGSGHAGVTIAKTLILSKKQILLIDFDEKPKKTQKSKKVHKYTSSRIDKSNFKQLTQEFIKKNNIFVKDFDLIACLKTSGLSNIWGGGFYLDQDYVSKNNLKINFESLKKNFNIDGYSKNISHNKILNKFQSNLSKNTNNNVIELFDPNFLYNKNDNNYYCTDEDLKILQKNKNFEYKNDCFLNNFTKNKDIFYLNTTNFIKENVLKTRNLILASGTISTTRLVIDYKKQFNQKVRLYHNPQLALLFITKKKLNNDNFKKLHAEVIYKIKLDDTSIAVGAIGSINVETIKSICDQYRFIPSFLIRLIINFLKNRIIIANCFLPNDCSNTYLIHTNDQLIIEGKKNIKYRSIKNIFLKKIKVSFEKISLFCFSKELPLGSDIHYTGTLTNQNLSNANLNFKNLQDEKIFIVDGSVIPSNPIYPAGYIINNAESVGLKILKSLKEDV